MKRASNPFPKVPEEPEEARVYHESASKRGRRIGRNFVSQLKGRGFEGGSVLDAGCGAGEVLIEIARAFPRAELVGLDLSEPLLEIARRQTEEAGLSERLTFKRGDVEAMPFEDDSFDLVISVNTLHVVDDPVAMMNEVERVLRPDGALVLTCIRRSWLGLFMPILKMGYTVEEVKEILGRSKLRTWKLRDYLLWLVVEATG